MNVNFSWTGLASVITVVAVSYSCGGNGTRSSIPTVSPAPSTPSASAPAPGHGGGGLSLASAVDLAHHFQVGVFAPEGIPLHGGVTAETDAKGALGNYGMGLFNG